MKNAIFLLSILLLFSCKQTSIPKQEIQTTDIDNFWIAYDKITTETDTVKQLQIVNDLYISKGTQGLKDLIQVRRYKAEDFVKAINEYPEFWKSLKKNTSNIKELSPKIDKAIHQLKQMYPELTPATIYFAIGAFRTNGTILGKNVLIGSEMSLTDKTINTSGLPEHLQQYYKEYQLLKDVDLLCAHEYIHTQQNELQESLLIASLYEGVAEFVSTKALSRPSFTPALAYGKEHGKEVKEKFETDMFIPQNMYNWLWGTNRNEFKIRDLGYYIGYTICENYYNKASDKKQAIKDMIELDYTDVKEVQSFVDASGYFSDTMENLATDFDKLRPKVVAIQPFKNNSEKVSSNTSILTIKFSEPMDVNSRGFDYGPLGENNVLRVQKVIGYSDDATEFSFEVALEPNKQYQSYVSSGFRNKKGIPLQPFLLDFKTGKK